MDKKVKYWIELAEYDLETAQVMLETGRLLYVGFMCHQVIEKAIKGYFTQVIGDMPPRTHNLEYVAEKCALLGKMDDTQRRFMQKLMPLNVESRYPSDREEIAQTLSKSICAEMISGTRELIEWIKKQL